MPARTRCHQPPHGGPGAGPLSGTQVNPARLHLDRLARLKSGLARVGCAGGLFYDPTNIRCATGTSNMQVYSLHNPCRYVFVAGDPGDGEGVKLEEQILVTRDGPVRLSSYPYLTELL